MNEVRHVATVVVVVIEEVVGHGLFFCSWFVDIIVVVYLLYCVVLSVHLFLLLGMFVIYFAVHMVDMAVGVVDMAEEVTEDDQEALVHMVEAVIEAVTVVVEVVVIEGRIFD